MQSDMLVIGCNGGCFASLERNSRDPQFASLGYRDRLTVGRVRSLADLPCSANLPSLGIFFAAELSEPALA